ncbi:MAG: FecR domain-containing protein, partial [Opitutales bacterium]
MKICNLPLVLLTLVPFIGAVANAAELASAKVLEVKGSVTYHAQGSEKPLKQGMIIKEGADLTTAPLSNAKLAFSNGSILTIQENSSLSFDELSQKSFNGNKTYEELEADPSESQTRLQLNYGKVRGETKKLRDESNFEVSSPLGTAAIRGTIFSVLVGYNAERGEYSFQVTNENGEVYVISRYSGALDFGRGNVASKGYSGDTEERRQSLP